MKMQKAIIGKKVGMTQIFDESGKVIPVTVIEAGPCVVTQKKTTEKDGYNAVQLGFEDVKESKLTKPELGHLKKAEVALKKHLKEFRVEKAAEMLRSTRLKTGTVGLECGFSDASYFIKTFREIKHCTPREYRIRFC